MNCNIGHCKERVGWGTYNPQSYCSCIWECEIFVILNYTEKHGNLHIRNKIIFISTLISQMPFKGLITLLQTNKELTILMYGDSYKMSRFLQEKTFKV